MTTQIDSQKPEITEKHIEIMRAVAHGADVYGYTDAILLREVQKHDPELISIGKAQMYNGDGTDQMPYFGAILTVKGAELVDAFEVRS